MQASGWKGGGGPGGTGAERRGETLVDGRGEGVGRMNTAQVVSSRKGGLAPVR